jgi:hypothetical protein
LCLFYFQMQNVYAVLLIIWSRFSAATFGPPQVASTHTAAYPMIYPCTATPAVYVSPQQFQYQPVPVSPFLHSG